MGVALVAEQFRPFGAQADHFGGDRAVVGRLSHLAARRPGAKRRLAQIPARGKLQERLDAGARQRDGVFAGFATLGGEPRRARDKEVRKALKIVGAEPERPGFLVGEHVLAELGGERREPFADRGEPRLGLGRQGGVGSDEIEMIASKRPRLLGGKPERGLAFLSASTRWNSASFR